MTSYVMRRSDWSSYVCSSDLSRPPSAPPLPSPRPWSGLWPGSESPFCALSMTVHLDDCGIDHRIYHVRLLRDGVEQPLENIGLHPIPIALEHRVPFAERARQVAPRAARPHDPQYRLDKASIIAAAAPRIADRKSTRLNSRH